MRHKIMKWIPFWNCICAALLFGAAACAHAGEETGKFRIIGLFSTERQDDLREVLKTIPDVKLVSLDYGNIEAVLSYDTAGIFPNAKPKSYTPEQIATRLSELLRNASQGTFSVQPPSTTLRDKLAKAEIPIGILDCRGCRFAAYMAVIKIAGVENVSVDSAKGILTASFDAAKTNRAAIEEALGKVQALLPKKP